MKLFKTTIKIFIGLIIFSLAGYFLSSKTISQFEIQRLDSAYKRNLDTGEYFLDLKCTRSSTFGNSGKLNLEIFSNATRIGNYEKNINLGRVKNNTSETSTIFLEKFNIEEQADYEIKTIYDGDNKIVSSCRVILSQSVPFLGVKRDNWFFLAIGIAVLMAITGIAYAVKERIKKSAELSGEAVSLSEPIKVISPKKEWLKLLPCDILFSIPLGIVMAIMAVLISKFVLKLSDDSVANSAFWMFPIAFVLMIIGTYLKVVEYRFYTDKLFHYTHLLLIGGEIIPYKNIISVNIKQADKTISIKYKDKDGENEELKIESDKANINEDHRQISDLLKNKV